MFPLEVLGYLPMLVEGFLLTIRLALLGGLASLGLGIVVGVLGVVPLRPARLISASYVELMRNIPPLVLLFFLFFGLPRAGLALDSFLCGLVGVSVYAAAFVGEAVRAGINAVARGQVEAARSLGFSYLQTMREVVLPQALMIVLPPLGNTFISLIKNTALVATIGVTDLMHQAELVESRTFATFPTFTLAALFYLALIFPLSLGVNTLERRQARSR